MEMKRISVVNLCFFFCFVFVGHEKIAKLIETYTPVPPTPSSEGMPFEFLCFKGFQNAFVTFRQT